MDVAAVALIRGQPGTKVTLTILRNGQQKQFTRAQLRSIRDIKYQNTPTGAVATFLEPVQMPLQSRRNQRFGEEGVAGYILDLRSTIYLLQC